ncbi:MAG TPA: Mrp/NBP35 family ATP-binding protein [Phycisphaerae bacterium]|nr:Mrp/NBP35 family ATP-binding protein [Phycisphaerae bacterium]HPS53114.1 Mrp/NBP35 family ATP-binding protein [Phycisphaerae bacterium]
MSETECKSYSADESQRQLEEVELQTNMDRIGHKIMVLSGKGGVGKSTVAANLAMSLAKAGKKVGLLDVDLHGPSIQKILGLDGQRAGCQQNGKIMPIRLSCNFCVITLGLFLDSEKDAVIWRGPMKYNVIRQFLKDTQWGDLDYLVIDLPPGTGDEPLNVAQLIGAGTTAVVVTTPQEVAISDVRRSLSFCKSLKVKVLGIIENMSGFTCPHCGRHVDIFRSGGGERLAAEMAVPFLGKIPFDPQIVESGDCGKPFVEKFADSQAARAFAEIIKPIIDDKTENEK